MVTPGRASARSLGFARTLALASLGALLWAAGCGGNGRPPPAEFETSGPPTTSPVSGGFAADSEAALPGCGTKPDGSSCDCIDAPLFTNPPNLYFVLDRSGSMGSDGKWSLVRSTVATLARGIGARAKFGAAMFPAPGKDQCAPGKEVLKPRLGDVPTASGANGPTTSALMHVTNVLPSGGTPTGATLTALLPGVKALTGDTFVVLATDGAPNCKTSTSCGIDQCVPNIEGHVCQPLANCCAAEPGNCLDGDATVEAAHAYAASGIPLYVVGIPGSAPYASLLDAVAVAGGTAQSGAQKYFRVDDKTQLLSALRKVAAKIVATCTFDLTEPPADPNAVNVYFDQTVVPKDPANGWSLEGKRVTLLGTACEKVLGGDVLGVRIIAGCPTVLPR